jgi:tetratricopeptide (TPR) repeat protein
MASRKNLPDRVQGRTPKEWIPSHLFSLCLLTVLSALTYANSLHGKFVFDDLSIVLQDPTLMNVKTFSQAMSPAVGGGWRPLLFVTYALNHYWGGLDTFGYHLVNVGLHVINVLLVYGILLSAFLEDDERSRYVALCGAAVFGVHTLLSGAVSYIAGRSSVLCGTFYFAAIYLFFKALKTERPQNRFILFGLTALAALLSWEAKQEAMTLPLFLAAVLFLRAKKIDWRWIAALAVVPVVSFVLMWERLKALYAGIQANQVLVSAGFEKVMPPVTYFLTYVTTVVEYFFRRFAFPVGLSVDPQIATVEYWYSSEFLFSVAVLTALAWLAVCLYRSQPLFALGITAILVSPLMAYAAIPLPDVVQEHRVYIPGLGLAFLFGALFQWLRQKYSGLGWAAAWAAPAAVVVVLGLMTASRNTVFANSISLWEDAVAKAPEKPRPHFNLGQAYQDAQRLPDAVREYEQSLALKPDIYAAYSNLAAIYLDQGQLQKGEEMLLKVTSLSPTFTEGFINLAVLYIRKRDPDKALATINKALETNPSSFAAHYNKGEVLTMKGEYKAAIESYKTAVYLRPDLDAFKLTLGTAYVRAGDPVSAEKQFNELTTSSVAAEAYRNLGLLYSNAGQPDQAIQYFNQATRLKPMFPEVNHDLGVVYLRKQMPDQAIDQFRTVLKQQPDHGPAVLNLAAAYQMKGDIPAAKQALQAYIQQYGNSALPYIPQVRQRLLALQ